MWKIRRSAAVRVPEIWENRRRRWFAARLEKTPGCSQSRTSGGGASGPGARTQPGCCGAPGACASGRPGMQQTGCGVPPRTGNGHRGGWFVPVGGERVKNGLERRSSATGIPFRLVWSRQRRSRATIHRAVLSSSAADRRRWVIVPLPYPSWLRWGSHGAQPVGFGGDPTGRGPWALGGSHGGVARGLWGGGVAVGVCRLYSTGCKFRVPVGGASCRVVGHRSSHIAHPEGDDACDSRPDCAVPC